MSYISKHAETLGVGDGLGESFFHFLLVLVVGKQENVKTGVGGRKSIRIASVARDHQLELSQTANGNAIASRRELECVVRGV